MSKGNILTNILKGSAKFHRIHPVLATAGRAGVGAGAGYAVAPEDKKLQGIQVGALAGGGSALLSKGARQGLKNSLLRQWHGATGHIPGAGTKPTAKDLWKIQSAKAHEGSMLARAKGGLSADQVRKNAITKARNELASKHSKGLTSLPGAVSAIRTRGGKQFAKDWWGETGWGGLAWPAGFGALSAAPQIKQMRSQDPAARKKGRRGLGQTIGSTLGWAAAGPLPMSVWYPLQESLGYLGKKVAG